MLREIDFPELQSQFVKEFGNQPQLFNAPGRINLIGEHTDYNDGFVLPAAVDKSVKIAMAENGTGTCLLKALDLNEAYEFELNTELTPGETGWANYFLGVIDQLRKRGATVDKGFDMIFSSNVPAGSGMSSSAAIECGFGYALNEMFDLGFSKPEIATIGQMAEHTFAGVKCGIMDQFASCMGKKNHVIKLDCRSMEYEYFPAEFGDYQLLLFDSKVKHNLASSEYNTRRLQCEEGVQALQSINPNITSLRDASLDELAQIDGKVPGKVFDRCKYIIEEIQRVTDTCEALQASDIQKVGELMFETHEGLSKLYEVSCSELDVLVGLVKDNPAVIGARMMGGGFGGCTINLVEKTKVDEVIESVVSGYKNAVNIDTAVYQVDISEGVWHVSIESPDVK
ncbi:MAG: galactokinase [Cyclobacteriaceae bacterium]